ncbi:hypothetical protein [Nostoc sp. CALU 546]|uniref:hypothetical protein n=1 Tax=Nostoc sp. CALU 546 TaxID=1867241 RepID=UPI003B67CF54
MKRQTVQTERRCVRPSSGLVPNIPAIYPTWQRRMRRETMMVVFSEAPVSAKQAGVLHLCSEDRYSDRLR